MSISGAAAMPVGGGGGEPPSINGFVLCGKRFGSRNLRTTNPPTHPTPLTTLSRNVDVQIMITGARVTVALLPGDTPAKLAERVRVEQRVGSGPCVLRSGAGAEATSLKAGLKYNLMSPAANEAALAPVGPVCGGGGSTFFKPRGGGGERWESQSDGGKSAGARSVSSMWTIGTLSCQSAPHKVPAEFRAEFELHESLTKLCHKGDNAAAAEEAITRLGGGDAAAGINLQEPFMTPPLGALFYAVHYGRPAIARVLCAHGADVNQQGESRRHNTPVHYVAGHLPSDVDADQLVDIDERRAACVQVLVTHGADVNAATGDDTNHALHKAAYLRLEQTALALARGGANLALVNGYGETPEATYRKACKRASAPANEAFLAELAELAAFTAPNR
jgi:hypothetical protein